MGVNIVVSSTPMAAAKQFLRNFKARENLLNGPTTKKDIQEMTLPPTQKFLIWTEGKEPTGERCGFESCPDYLHMTMYK